MIEALLGILGVLLAASVVPGPWRDAARAGVVFYLLLSPLLALAAWLSTRDVEPGTWTVFLPLTIAWFFTLDLTMGVSRRLSRRTGRREGHLGAFGDLGRPLRGRPGPPVDAPSGSGPDAPDPADRPPGRGATP